MKKMCLYLSLLLLITLSVDAQSLPRVDLWYSTLSSDTFSVGSFRLIVGSDTLSSPIQVRHRGSYSLNFDKPTYAVKIVDEMGEKRDISLLGMRSDNYWILDAMASDHARMRNRVSMDLWLEFSRKPWYWAEEPEMLNGYRGQMVQVFVNDSAQGIYCLMERADRKQLKLKKYSAKKGVQGVLYSTYDNKDGAEYILSSKPVDTLSTWIGWEQKYPDPDDGEPICWTRLYNHILACATGSTHIQDTVQRRIDWPVFVDYTLFWQLLSARDNIAKNVYLSYYNATDSRALYTPWDLDHSWGRQHNSKLEPSNTAIRYGGHKLYINLYTYASFSDTLAARYAELRSHYFTVQHIDSLFAPYFELYRSTGMDTVEQHIWSGHNGITLDIPSEQSYIHRWVTERLAFLDSIYRYTPIPTGVEEHEVPSSNGLNGSNGLKGLKGWKVLSEGRIYIVRGKDVVLVR